MISRDDGSGFIDFAKEPVGSTKYYDYGLIPNTSYSYKIYSVSDTETSVDSNIVTAVTSNKGLPKPPKLIGLKSGGSDQITIIWENPDDISNISTYEIERRIQGKEGYTKIASVALGINDFTDTKLLPNTVYTYRIFSADKFLVIGIPSNDISGVSSVDPVQLDTQGKIIEPNPINSFIKGDAETIAQTIELFNIPSSSMISINDDIHNKKLNVYEIILKMNNGTYGNTQEIKNAGAFYGAFYLETGDISQFKDTIIEKVLIALDGERQ